MILPLYNRTEGGFTVQEMKRLAVDLDEDLRRHLKEIAARERKSVMEVVRELLMRWVKKKRPE